MKLYLVRHGDALSKQLDAQRSLSETGYRDVTRIGRFLARAGIRVSEIRHSGKQRAAQTARIIAQAIDGGEPVAHDGLNPNDPVAPVIEELAVHRGDLMMVGHLPFMSDLAAALLCDGGCAFQVTLRAGGVICLDRQAGSRWTLQWMVVPSLLTGE